MTPERAADQELVRSHKGRGDGPRHRSSPSGYDGLLGLHRAAGNQVVERLVQTRLTVGKAEDPYEVEADRTAEAVVRSLMGEGGAAGAPGDRDENGLVLRSATSADPLGGTSVDAGSEAAIARARRGGVALEPEMRSRMEEAFGADFGAVRLHGGQQADRLSRSLQARAFTTGADIFFAAGAYRPETRAGQSLLAHELTHVVQQGAAGRVGRRLDRLQRPPASVQRVLQPIPDQALAAPDIEQEQAPVRARRLPAELRSHIERSSGVGLRDVRVFYDSPRPAELQALAYTQGSDIHVAPAQEKMLAHEAWHVVQQKQGRARATTSTYGVPVDDSPSLEREADRVHDPSAISPARSDAPIARSSVPAHPVVQLVKAAIAQPGPGQTVAQLRALIALMNDQAAEYDGYPVAVAGSDGRQLTEVKADINRASTELETIVSDLGLGDAEVITRGAVQIHYQSLNHIDILARNIFSALGALNNRFAAWQTWIQNNPDTVNDLDAANRKTGADLSLDAEDDVIYGTYNFLLYRVAPGNVPERADKDAIARYQTRLQQDAQVVTLRQDVAGIMGQPAAKIRGDLADSKSVGAGAMRTELNKAGNMTMTRCMSVGEAQGVRAAGGNLLRKDAAAKWVTIGAAANINSLGDATHNQVVQWVVLGNFRKVLLKPGMNYYNENAVNRSEYLEPYWVWKDAEGANIAFSPVLVPIFNDMIVSVTINRTPVERG